MILLLIIAIKLDTTQWKNMEWNLKILKKPGEISFSKDGLTSSEAALQPNLKSENS